MACERPSSISEIMQPVRSQTCYMCQERLLVLKGLLDELPKMAQEMAR